MSSEQDDTLCIGCEQRPARRTGEWETWIEGIAQQLLYCQECIDNWPDQEIDADGP
jgi:hypothetical protein